jgi:hypothetical protein
MHIQESIMIMSMCTRTSNRKMCRRIFLIIAVVLSWLSTKRAHSLVGIAVKPNQPGKHDHVGIHNYVGSSTSTSTSTSTNTSLMAEATGCANDPIFKGYFDLDSPRNDLLPPLWKQALSPKTHSNNPFENKTLIIIGDSLDRKVLENACYLINGKQQMLEPHRKSSRPFVCISSSPTLNTGYLNIFGMRRPCENGITLRLVEPRPFNTTAERIETLLPGILELLPLKDTPGDFYVQVGSNLWDLSQGCNNQPEITDEYEKQYRMGVMEVATTVHDVIHKYLVNKHGNQGLSAKVHIIWKLAPPISLDYSNRALRKGGGRVRKNQEALNSILMDVVTSTRTSTAMTSHKMKIGSGIVDWWKLVQDTVPSEDLLNAVLKKDGRHFSKCPNLAFFDVLLKEVQRLATSGT